MREGASSGAPQQQGPVMPAQQRPPAERVIAGLSQLFEDAQAALHGDPDLESDAAGEHAPERCTLVHEFARTIALELHQRAPGCVTALLSEVTLADAERLHLILRQVYAPLAPVERYVLPEIDQLQRSADVVRLTQRCFVRSFEKVQQ